VDDFLIFLGFVGPLVGFVFVFAPIHNPADRRVGIG
jgi:hypothetical protein